jgi:transposase
MAILDSAAEIGIKQAAELAGVHYTTVYDWRRQLKSMGKQIFIDYKPSYRDGVSSKLLPKRKKPYWIPGMIIPVLVPAR